MDIKKLLGLPLYLKFKDSRIKKYSLLVYPAYNFSLYLVLRSKGDFALIMDENFKIKFISTQKYVNVDYNFILNINTLLQDKLENPDIILSEDFYNYFYDTVNNTKDFFVPSVCLYEKQITNGFFILNPKDETKGYWVDIEVKVYVCNNKTKFKETIDVNDTRTVHSHFGILKYNTKSKNLHLSMKRIFTVKKDVELLTSEIKF